MSILHDIINWVEDKPSFWKVAINRLIRNNNLSEKDISDIKEVCKVEFGFSKFVFEEVDFDSLRDFANNRVNSDSIKLSKIQNIDNINALSKTNTLEFSETGLTAVYGDNGAGKSSYVSILKHICNTRGDKPYINDNLYDDTCKGKDQKAEVECIINDEHLDTIELVNTQISDSTLKSVDVFDTSSANHYIEREGEIAFIPQGLLILEKFAISLKEIESKLNNELQELEESKFNTATLNISENTSAKRFLDGLNSRTSRNALRAFSAYTEIKEERIDEIKEEISKLKLIDPQVQIRDNTAKVDRFTILKNKFDELESFLFGENLVNIQNISNTYIVTSETLKVSSEKIFSELPLNGVGEDSWKQLWESARTFYNESREQEIFPEVADGTNCPLCLQVLDEDAKKRFSNFEEFIKDDIQKKYDDASLSYNLILKSLNDISFDLTEQEPTIKELEDIIENYSEIEKLYLEELAGQKTYLMEKLSEKINLENLTEPKITNNPKILIQSLIEQLNQENIKLNEQSIEEELKRLENELFELLAEKEIYKYRFKLVREIYRQKKSEYLTQCTRECNTRKITTFSNDLSSQYINQNLKDNFKLELKKLGFKNIKIDTEIKGRRGKQYCYLKLDESNGDNNIKLKDILSEGEHRCIALATFLSELSLSSHSSSIIFDDPVSSLDHQWRNRIAKRIIDESQKRQVIVFTHDITFLMMLEEHSKRIGSDFDIKSLTRKKRETGIIAMNPPWDALSVKKRIGILKNDLQVLQKIEREETEEVYRERVKPIYGKLRETWERFVEEIVLNKVIQRFGREIQTQRLKVLTDITDDDYQKIDMNMGKCSTYFYGHDSAGTLIEDIPSIDEVTADIDVLEKYLKEMRKRKRN